MKTLTCLCLAVGIIAFTGSRNGFSQETKNEPGHEDKSLKELIQELSDPDPEVRQKAHEGISKMGPNAGPAACPHSKSKGER
jgi:hypothetical protein